MRMNTTIKYNWAGCTALMRGKIHSQSTFINLSSIHYLNSGCMITENARYMQPLIYCPISTCWCMPTENARYLQQLPINVKKLEIMNMNSKIKKNATSSTWKMTTIYEPLLLFVCPNVLRNLIVMCLWHNSGTTNSLWKSANCANRESCKWVKYTRWLDTLIESLKNSWNKPAVKLKKEVSILW